MHHSYTAALADLIEAGRSAVSRGLAQASGGNLSLRIEGGFLVTGSGTRLDQLGPTDFTHMGMDGERLNGPPPSSEWKLHHRAYAQREDANVVIHLHPQNSVLLDALGHRVRLFTLDHVAYVRSIGTVGFYPNGSAELADHTARQLQDHNCVILSHHGCCVVGEDALMAYRRVLNLEEAALATYKSLLLGDTTSEFPHDREALHA